MAARNAHNQTNQYVLDTSDDAGAVAVSQTSPSNKANNQSQENRELNKSEEKNDPINNNIRQQKKQGLSQSDIVSRENDSLDNAISASMLNRTRTSGKEEEQKGN